MLDILSVLSEDVIKLLAAVAIGSLIGAEREYHDKAAGLRTLILICVGSTLFTHLLGRHRAQYGPRPRGRADCHRHRLSRHRGDPA
jgi:uncharacterized membrane protein YhiD involved in acid resistance